MTTKVFVFYSIAFLSLTLFVVSAKTDNSAVGEFFPETGVGYALIESVNQLIYSRK